MTKMELIKLIAEKMGITQKESAEAVNLILESMADTLSKGESIKIKGFGVFNVKQMEEKIARNPKTGEKVKVPPKKVVRFKPGKELKEMVNE